MREFFKGFSNLADRYFLKVELRDANGLVLDSWEAGNETTPLIANGAWQLQEYRFVNYPAGVREISWADGGSDAEFWAGHYGTLLDGAELTFDDPAPRALQLTPGTYPLNAPSGGISGILNTDDSPEASHTYDLVGETDRETIVPLHSDWSFLDDGSDQGIAWIQPNFDDRTWSSGFAELGYGEGDELSTIAGQGIHFTNYFRHRFMVEANDLAEITALTLLLKRDDGAVVSLNGTEIVRENLPAGPIAFDTPATSASDNGQLFFSFNIDPDLLVEGENVLAVEIHQVNLTSSDASFDLDASLQATATVRVRATDRSGFTTERPLTITIVEFNNPPTDLTLSGLTLVSNSAAGTLLGTLGTADLDQGDTHDYSLTAVKIREELFGFGSVWRFLDDNSDPGSLWTSAFFNEASWKSGNGSFGYGDVQTTAVDPGPDTANKFITTYFRRSFQVANPAAYESYELLVRRDDGVAVYLNGAEAGRDNLPAGADASTLAMLAISEAAEATPVAFNIEPGSLVTGNNLLAAEIHQSTPTSSDLTFDLALVGVVDASAASYFEIVNGNEIRTAAAFANADQLSGTSLDLIVRTTDPAGDFSERAFTIQVTSDNPADLDNDKLPDAWELTYFASLATQRGDDDSDADGSSNYEEFLYDTIPNDPFSKLAFEIIPGDDRYTVRWFSSRRRSYQLQSSLTLEPDAWTNTQNGQRIGIDNLMGETFAVADFSKRHFRLVIETP